MPELITEKKVKARKAHKCRTCFQEAVQPGEEYIKTTYKFDGRIYDWVMCSACEAALTYVWEWATFVENGIGADTYDEWAFDIARGGIPKTEKQLEEQRAAIAYLVRRWGMTPNHHWVGITGVSEEADCVLWLDGTELSLCGRPKQDHIWSHR